jgi:hypothetical protein
MKRPKRTKGPWKARFFPSHFTDIVTESGVTIISWPGFDSSDVPVDEQAGNALVMAAAPDLLKVCQAISKAASKAKSEEHFGELVTEQLDALCTAIEKATKKAKDHP